ncbi:MAG: methyl-accepting chemotaxis protein [Myxococcota bacterium]
MSQKQANPFAGTSRWVSLPSTFAGLLGAALAVLYGVATLELPPGTRWWLVGMVAVVAVAASVWGDFREQAFLSTLRAIGRGELALTRAHLRAAVVEVSAFADRALRVALEHWCAGVVVIGVSYGFVPSVSWELSARIVFLGIVLAPVTALFTHLAVIGRARQAVERLADAGLSAAEVIEAVPPRRLHLRRRLMLFTAVAVLTPTVLIADVTLQNADRTMERLLAADTPTEQHAVLGVRRQETVLPGVAMGAMVILLVIGSGFVAGSVLGRPMKAIADEATRIAGGDLTRVRVIPAEDEVWAAAAAFTAMQAQLIEAVLQLRRAGLAISSTTEKLVASSGRHKEGASEQTSALAQTSATTEELARSARHISGNASEVAKIAEETLGAALFGKKSADHFRASMGKMRSDNQAIADAVVRLNKRVQQIGKIVEFIDGIADKSDLLALNAELEGTKAGEVGRGFSLVAAEMRRLAESVLGSTKEIGRLIEEIRDATNAAVMATEAGVKATEAGAALSAHVSSSLAEIVALAQETSEAVKSMSVATHQQQTGTDQLAEAMTDLLRSTQAGTDATRQIAAANVDLSTLSRDLEQVVERFQVSG